MADMPAPPMATRCTRRGDDRSMSGGRSDRRSPADGRGTEVAADRGRRRRRRRDRARARPTTSRGVDRRRAASATSVASRSVVTSSSATSTAPPARDQRHGVGGLVVTGSERERHEHRRHADDRQLGHGRPTGAAHREVGGGQDAIHAVLVADRVVVDAVRRRRGPFEAIPVAAAEHVVDVEVGAVAPRLDQPDHGTVDRRRPERSSEGGHDPPARLDPELAPRRGAVAVGATGEHLVAHGIAGDHGTRKVGLLEGDRARRGEATEQPVGRPRTCVLLGHHDRDPEHHRGGRRSDRRVAAEAHDDAWPHPDHRHERLEERPDQPPRRGHVVPREATLDPPARQQQHLEAGGGNQLRLEAARRSHEADLGARDPRATSAPRWRGRG